MPLNEKGNCSSGASRVVGEAKNQRVDDASGEGRRPGSYRSEQTPHIVCADPFRYVPKAKDIVNIDHEGEEKTCIKSYTKPKIYIILLSATMDDFSLSEVQRICDLVGTLPRRHTSRDPHGSLDPVFNLCMRNISAKR